MRIDLTGSVIAATVCQLIFANRYSRSADPFFDGWRLSVCTQTVLAAGIVTACVPQFKRLLDLLESWMLRSDDLRRRRQSGSYGYTGAQSKDPNNHDYKLQSTSLQRSLQSQIQHEAYPSRPSEPANIHNSGEIWQNTEMTITNSWPEANARSDKESQRSTAHMLPAIAQSA